MKILSISLELFSILQLLSKHIKYWGIAFYVCFIFCESLCAQEVEYGLKFKSYETERERRTSLILSPDKHFNLPANYLLSFDVKFHSNLIYPFGYILRIINEDKKHMDFLLSQEPNTGESRVVFTFSSEEVFRKTFAETDIEFDKWIPINIRINTKDNLLNININGHSYTEEVSGLKSFGKAYIGFGKIIYPGFELSDVPSMSIRHIKLQDKNDNNIYSWPLREYTSGGTLDEMKNKVAQVFYPEWEINRHAIWEKQQQFKTSLLPEITYNTDKDEVVIYDTSSLYQYNIKDRKINKKGLESETYNRIQSNNMIYDPLSGNYLQYIFELEEEKELLVFDTLRNKWNYSAVNTTPTDYWHHNHYISEKDSCLYLFGGYGHHKYKNEVRIYDFTTRAWSRKKITGDVPRPHYLSGLGKLDDDHILLFGGYGSETGNQELSPGYSYNLYKIHTGTLHSVKLWTLPDPSRNFVVANSLVVDTVSNTFYTLAFPSQEFNTRISLLQFSIDKPEYICLNDSLPVNFEDNRSFVDFYQTSGRDQLIAVTSGPHSISDSINTVAIYTLSYPPIPAGKVYQEKYASRFVSIFLSGLMIVFGIAGILILYRSMRRKKQNIQDKLLPEREEISHHYHVAHKKRNQLPVTLLGGFCVTDREGNDITKDFSPMLKQLFVLLILYTSKNPKGISSVKLKEILWYDKSEESARNNRGVSIRKLRQILNQVGNIQILNANSYWKVEFHKNVGCDYIEAFYLMEMLAGNNDPDPAHIIRLVELVSAGELLPNIQIEWIDSFKADFSDKLIDLLLRLSEHSYIKEYPKHGLDLADAIFIHDSLNEDALRLKCTLLVKSGKNGMARKIYDSFCKEYNLLFGSKYPHLFDQIIS